MLLLATEGLPPLVSYRTKDTRNSMDPEWKITLLQLTVKMQAAVHELYVMMNDHPELQEAVNQDKVGDADYRIGLLTTHLIDIAAN